MYFLIGLIIDGLLALIPANIAKNKGRDFATWYIYGVCLFFIAFLHSLFLDDKNKVTASESSPESISKTISIREILQDIPNEVDINAIANIESYALLSKDDELLMRFKVRNLENKPIRAIKIIGKAYTDFGDLVKVREKESFEILLQDLMILPLGLEEKTCSLIPELRSARNFVFFVSQVCYDNGEIIQCKLPNKVKTCQDEISKELLSFAQKENSKAKYYMKDSEDYWQCVCGYVNTKEICAYCKMSKKSAQRYSKTCIKSNYEIFLNDEHIRLEKEKEYQKKIIEEKKTKNKKVTKMIGITASIVITILIVSIGCYYVITEKNNSQIYIQGVKYYEDEKWELAMGEFSKILTYKDSEERYENASGKIKLEIQSSLNEKRNRSKNIIDTEYAYAWAEAEIVSFMGQDIDFIKEYCQVTENGAEWIPNYEEMVSENIEVYDLVDNTYEASDPLMTIQLDENGLKEVYRKWGGTFSASEQLEWMCGRLKRNFDEQDGKSYYWYYDNAPVSCIEFNTDYKLDSTQKFTIVFYR
ncbi:hypothetical protein EV212_1241 [Frisingicoccus caecimuris]|uniref:Uncharacterized protein n=2 Tax=Frisingicoccus caecimuris TaxID=1796636 RepID=A0A4R2L352_9FIRM|nr:hypothetical protein EV212_1241 [Frisingicoccus caecimuris]